jgi:hypothetical protein
MGLAQMLAEKFFLILETILSNRHSDGAPHNRSESRFVPIVNTPPSSNVSRQSDETYLEEAKPARGPI